MHPTTKEASLLHAVPTCTVFLTASATYPFSINTKVIPPTDFYEKRSIENPNEAICFTKPPRITNFIIKPNRLLKRKYLNPNLVRNFGPNRFYSVPTSLIINQNTTQTDPFMQARS